MTKEGSRKIVNFMTPGTPFLVLGHGHIVKMRYFSPLLVNTGSWIREIKYLVMMTMKGSTEIFNTMTPPPPRDCTKAWLCHVVEMHYLLHYLNKQHIDCYCIKGLWCCFPVPLLNFIYPMMGLLICKYEPFWQEISEVFETPQVTVKACWPLVNKKTWICLSKIK